MKVLVSSTSVNSAAAQVAEALRAAGALHRFATTFRYDPDAPGMALLRRWLPALLEKELERRRAPRDLVPFVEFHHPAGEFARIAASRFAHAVVADKLWEWGAWGFDRSVARSLCGEVDAVYGFEHTCHHTFERARELGIRRIYDLSAPFPGTVDATVEAEFRKFPDLRSAMRAHVERHAEERAAYKRRELELTDLAIANSDLTAATYVAQGVPRETIRVVPLGAPPINRGWRKISSRGPVKFLFAGSASLHKGIPYLATAWKKISAGQTAQLTIAGHWALSPSARSMFDEKARLIGSVPRSDLESLYLHSDVLVLPSLFDGFGMVVTEAFAHGLPVIVTDRVGASSLVVEGRNGFVVRAGDGDALAERLEWCLSHRTELRAMREAAEQTARENQWSDYRANLARTILEFLGGREEALDRAG